MAKKLFIGNLSFDTNEESLRSAFSKFGAVESAQIITDRMTGRSRGFGFVEMSVDEDAEKAVAGLNGQELDGRALTVNEARPMANRPGGDRPTEKSESSEAPAS